ncbi:MAG TPA: hypothetical protein VE398_14415, partial [Acidobacteriota bacterium]|nr:hypothetical protein [Acidobacteriota bacterium]
VRALKGPAKLILPLRGKKSSPAQAEPFQVSPQEVVCLIGIIGCNLALSPATNISDIQGMMN